MAKPLYVVTRDLHLYIGLFLSPFVLVFAASVFYLVHIGVGPRPPEPVRRTVSNLPVLAKLEGLSGREQVSAQRPIFDQIGVKGEINFVRRIVRDHRLVVPVMLPGHETTVDLDLANRTAVVSERRSGIGGALVHLHKMPGPHNVSIRVNSPYMRAWRWLADAVPYGLIFLTLSGVYLWAVLRAERRVGVVLLSAGAVSFFGLVYAIVR